MKGCGKKRNILFCILHKYTISSNLWETAVVVGEWRRGHKVRGGGVKGWAQERTLKCVWSVRIWHSCFAGNVQSTLEFPRHVLPFWHHRPCVSFTTVYIFF